MELDPSKDITLSEAAKRRKVTPQAMSYLVNKKNIFKKVKRFGWNVFLDVDEVDSYKPDKGGHPKKLY